MISLASSRSEARATSASNFQTSTGIALAMVTLGLALWLLAGMAFPGLKAAGLAGGLEARAGAALATQPATPRSLDIAEAQSRAALALAPMNAWSWLRLAYVDRVRHGALTSEGVRHLQASYDVAPYGPQVTAWRITFALDNWSALPGSLKREVLSEIGASWPIRAATIDAAIANSTSRPGRLAARVVVERRKLDAARRWTSATP